MADTIESLASGFMCGLSWSLDHDETTGDIGVSATGAIATPGDKLDVTAILRRKSDGVVVWQFSQEIDQFANLGRQVLFTSAALKNMTIYPVNPTFTLDIRSTCGPDV